ncbi:MAG: hypothetical protein FWF77_09870 [Defluviitaleaceae bacterium]|nr:hypothetical protein [Defluviitaleaceae bacterium]
MKKNFFKKARQARIGHRGHMSRATHSLEAGSNFLAHKKNAHTRVFTVFKNQSNPGIGTV